MDHDADALGDGLRDQLTQSINGHNLSEVFVTWMRQHHYNMHTLNPAFNESFNANTTDAP